MRFPTLPAVTLLLACLAGCDLSDAPLTLVDGETVPLTDLGGGWVSDFDTEAVPCSTQDCCDAVAVEVFDTTLALQARMDALLGGAQPPDGTDLYRRFGLLAYNDACDGPGWSLEPVEAVYRGSYLELSLDLVEPSRTESVPYRSWSLSSVDQAEYGRVEPLVQVR